jgi:ABC-type transporter Mla subunit MlaD
MTSENGRRPAARGRKRQINWVAVGIIVFALAIAALGAWADSIGGNAGSGATPAASATAVPVGAPISP